MGFPRKDKSSKMPAPISFFESMGVVAGVGLAMLANMSQRKPMNTGIYKHVILGGVGYFCGKRVMFTTSGKNGKPFWSWRTTSGSTQRISQRKHLRIMET